MLNKITNFIKIEHTIFSLPLIFAGAYLGASRHIPSLYTLALIIMAGVGARTFGMSMNRILDRKIDLLNKRTKGRELPSGKLSLNNAIGIAAVGFGLYMLACYLLGPFILMLSPLPLFILSTYSLLKRFTWACHFGIGLVLGSSPLGAYVAVTQSLNFTPEILLLAGFTIFWMSGYDIIYSLQDIDFDKNNNIYSIPSSFGGSTALVVAAITHVISFIFLFSLSYFLYPNIILFFALFACGIFYLLSHMPFVPLETRFFPLSAITGILGAMVVFL